MSSHDKRYDKSAPWKSQSGSGRDSPERYRKRNSDSPTRHYNSYKNRRYYDNRSWNYSPYAKRYSSDHSRYSRYERKPETSDDKKQHEGEKSEVPTTERGTRNFTNKSTWSSTSSSHIMPNTEKPPWLIEQQPLETNSALVGTEISAQNKFNFIFQHINAVYSQNDETQANRPMSFIDRIIADEAMRMLSAASSSEATSLNEPCETADVASNNAPVSDETEPSKQEEGKAVFDSKINDKVGTFSATNSAMLQKSAEQVTKKLINQLSTMSKYDLKHMIDNPAGKYQTALNRHAQSKLRAEVRKQLKSFGLGKLGSSCVTGDGTVESDEAIDADKIPTALLAKIGQVLDLEFFDLPPTESSEAIEQLPDVVKSSQSNSIAPESNGTQEPQALLCSTSTSINIESADHVVADQTLNVAKVSRSPRPAKNTTAPNCFPKTPAGGQKIIIRKANKATILNKKAVREAVVSTLQPAAIKPFIKKNFTVQNSKQLSEGNSKNIASSSTKSSTTKSLVITPVESLKYVSQNNGHAMSKDTITDVQMNSLDNVNPTPGDRNSGVKNGSLLRVSTVEELNRRLDERPGKNPVEIDQEFDQRNVIPERGLTRANISNASDQSASMDANLDSIASSTDEIRNLNGTNHPSVEMLTQAAECTAENRANAGHLQITHNHNNNANRSQSPALSIVQHQKQLNCQNVPPRMNQTEPVNNTNADISKKIKAVLLEYMANKNQAQTSIDQAVEIENTAQAQNTTPKVNEDEPMAPVTQGVLPDLSFPVLSSSFKKRKRPKKRKFSPAKVLKMDVQTCGTAVTDNGQINIPSWTANLGEKGEKGKASLFASTNNTGNANNASAESLTSATEWSSSLQSAEVLPNEDHILNNAYDQYLGNSLADRAPETMEQPTRITIANVCSISGSEDVSTSATVVTENAANATADKNRLDLQLTQAISLAKPKDETTTSPHSVQRIPNFAPLDDCSDGNVHAWNLSTESIAESKEGIERIVLPQPVTGKSSEEYILGGDSEDNCVPNQPSLDGLSTRPGDQAQFVANHSSAPSLPTPHIATLQALCEKTEEMQSVEAQVMELHKRKTQIDAIFMQLHAERMDIDQQLERLHHMRSLQINLMRLNLLELISPNGSNESIMQVPSPVTSDSGTGSNGISVKQTIQSGQISGQTGVRQQERTIRRITPICGDAIKIFQRRRAPSERSAESNLPVVDQA
ncbi:uncharacterized protein LOC125764056 [Anopheles funestus]|uniref:uncharacterized protein LOC125764056 n=1 Tax=Anopheles funestus TaxID=62324 RepID=UPI0020C682FE|nr:uncharacterized protein LOC125764056 [Anopheles funestus]XP_049283842.1 uncharacterized protein LOC125764056 [Anopheles funestus]